MSEKNELKRNLSLVSALCIMCGCIVGTSVFVIPGELAASIGPGAWLAYFLGGLLVMGSCFLYSQIGAVIPSAGANYILCTSTVNSTWGFLYVWCFFLGNSFLLPITSRTAAKYLAVVVPGLADHITLTASVIVILVCIINLFGNEFSSAFQKVSVFILVSVIFVFIGSGLIHADWSSLTPVLPNGPRPLVVGVISSYYAFAGITCIMDMSGEIVNPGKNLPRTVFIGCIIGALIYMGMCVAISGNTPAGVADPATAVASVSEGILPGWFSYAIVFATVAASYSTLNVVVASMTRVIFTLGRTGIFPKATAKLNRFHVPYIPQMFLAVLGCVMIVFSSAIMQYVNVSSFFLMFIAFIIAVSSLQIRKVYAKEYENAPYKLKGSWYYLCPILTVFIAIVFMAAQIITDTVMTLIAVALVPLGLVIYHFREKALKKAGIDVTEQLKDL